MRWSIFLSLALVAGCGRIEYGESTPRTVAYATPSTGGTVVTVPSAAAPAPTATVAPAPDGVVYVPWDPGAQPAAPATAAPFVAAPAGAAVTCSGAQRIRIHDEIVDGRGGPAVVATGGCVVQVSEAIIRGEPAIFVSDQARVELVESRIQGDVRSVGAAQVSTRGCRHDRGSVQHL